MFKINEKFYYLSSPTNKDDLYFSSVLFKEIKSYDSEKFMARISFFTSVVSANSSFKMASIKANKIAILERLVAYTCDCL